MRYSLRMASRVRTLSFFVLIVGLIALIVLLSIQKGIENVEPPVAVLTQEQRDEAERIIRARINTLSPNPPVLGGRFDVRMIEWNGRGRAIVTYGDGESTLKADVRVLTGSGKVKIDAFTIAD